MARRKRNSSVLERAERRIESLQSISVQLDFGQGLTIQAYNMTINDLRSKLAAYNTALSTIDKLTDDVNNAEQAVIAISEKMLLGVASRYGKISQEYEMAGGARRGNTKKKRSVLGNSKVTNPNGNRFCSAFFCKWIYEWDIGCDRKLVQYIARCRGTACRAPTNIPR